MKLKHLTYLSLISVATAQAEGLKSYSKERDLIDKVAPFSDEDRKKAAIKLSKNQDELSADVQELIEDQTNEEIIAMFENIEGLMASVTNNLEESNTGKDTIFTENQIIEKIFEAAEEKSKWQSGGGWQSSQKNMGAMLEQLKEAMGEGSGKGKGESETPGEGEGEGGSNTPGQGGSGTTDKDSQRFSGSDNSKEARTLEKKAGIKSESLPDEYQGIIDAYNKAQQNK